MGSYNCLALPFRVFNIFGVRDPIFSLRNDSDAASRWSGERQDVTVEPMF